MNRPPQVTPRSVDRPHEFKIKLSIEERDALGRMIKRTGKNGAQLVREFLLGEP